MQIENNNENIQWFWSNSGFGPDPNGHYDMRLTGPEFILEGPYSIKGQILVLPIQGQGRCNFTLLNPELRVRFTGKTKVKNGKTHLYTDDLRMTFKITRWGSRFFSITWAISVSFRWNSILTNGSLFFTEWLQILRIYITVTVYWVKQRIDF